MRRIIEIIVIAVFLLTISYVGWILFDKISNRSKREANENNAIKVIKKINQAQSDAKNRFGKYLSLEELSEKNLIDSEIKSGKSSGYNFSIKSEGEKYSVLASPNPGEGNLSFYSDESGVIRSSYKLIAGPNDPPSRLQNLVE